MNNNANTVLIGRKLKVLREEYSYTQEELAAYFNDDIALICEWEDGIREPTLSEGKILSKLYGISLDEILSCVQEETILSKAIFERYKHEAWLNAMKNRAYEFEMD